MTRRLGLTIGQLCVLSAAGQAQAPRVLELRVRPKTVHWGYYDATIPPALRVASGDRVRVETMVAGDLQRLRLAGVAESEITEVTIAMGLNEDLDAATRQAVQEMVEFLMAEKKLSRDDASMLCSLAADQPPLQTPSR